MIQKAEGGQPFIQLRSGKRVWLCPECEKAEVGKGVERCQPCRVVADLEARGIVGPAFVRTETGHHFIPGRR